jgi:hypothetical protein
MPHSPLRLISHIIPGHRFPLDHDHRNEDRQQIPSPNASNALAVPEKTCRDLICWPLRATLSIILWGALGLPNQAPNLVSRNDPIMVSPIVAAGRASLSPETQLLLLTAAVSPSDAALRQALSIGINWEELCALARHEKATPILLRQLGRVDADPGASGYRELREQATIAVMEMLQLEQLLHQTIDILAQHEIEAVLLKGAGLAYTAYSSFADRPMGDIDLLVRPQHVERAWSLLQEHDWKPQPTDGDSTFYADHHHLPPLFRDSGRFRLEMHGELLPVGHPFRFSTDAFWMRAHGVTVNSRVITVPSPIDQLWHTCVHFAWSHGMQWGSWRALRDSAAIIRREGFGWTEFVNFARETQAATCCFWTLRLARHLAGAAVPDDVLASLRPPYPEFIIERLERHFASNLFPSDARCPSVSLTRWLWEAGVLPRWSRRGAVRPWKISEKWLAASGPPKSELPTGRALTGWFRRVRATVTYLLRLSRFSLPVTAVNVSAAG